MASPVTAQLLPLALLLRELATLGEGGGGADAGSRAPGSVWTPATRRCRRSRRAEPVPLIAQEGGGQPRPAGGAAVRGAAVQRGAGLHLALPEERTCRPPHLPGIPLQKPDQVGRGAGPQTDLGPEDSGHPLQSHPAQIPQGGRRLLFLLGREQLRSVLQRLRPGLPASQAHHYARAATAHSGAHHHVAAGVSAPGDLPAFSGQHSGSKWAGLVL